MLLLTFKQPSINLKSMKIRFNFGWLNIHIRFNWKGLRLWTQYQHWMNVEWKIIFGWILKVFLFGNYFNVEWMLNQSWNCSRKGIPKKLNQILIFIQRSFNVDIKSEMHDFQLYQIWMYWLKRVIYSKSNSSSASADGVLLGFFFVYI